jgi:pimeloyl-ACP methyl ester carboxylesterase
MRHPAALLWLLPALLFSTLVTASDLEREQRIHDQIVDAIFDGEPVMLEAEGHSFLAIHMESDSETRKGAAILLHGRGLHPAEESVAQPLRTALPSHGWDTLSLQMPVLSKEAKYFDYVPIFPESFARIEAGIAYLKARGAGKIVLIAHSCGAHMAMNWIEERGDKAIDAYVGISMGATDYKQPMVTPFPLDKMAVPVLDIYGSEDYPAVRRLAPERWELIQGAGHPYSAQRTVSGAEHYYSGRQAELIETVAGWLNGLE